MEEHPDLYLLVTGEIADNLEIEEDNVSQAIQTFSLAAQKDPYGFLDHIREVVEVKIDGMVMIAMAVLAVQAPERVLRSKTFQDSLMTIFSVYGPPKLLEFIELLKSKVFGRGFGSRPQKWIRTVMEEWSIKNLKDFSLKHPKDLYSLIMLVHPRYNDHRGNLIRRFLNSKNLSIN